MLSGEKSVIDYSTELVKYTSGESNLFVTMKIVRLTYLEILGTKWQVYALKISA